MAALLAGIITGSLLAGRLPVYSVLILSLFVAAGFWLTGHHHHDGVLSIDGLARRSRLYRENAFLKAGGSVALLFCCLCSPSPWPPVCLFLFLTVVTVCLGGIRIKDYASLMGVPVVFLLLSALTLLWDFTATVPRDAVLSVPLFGGYLIVEPAAQLVALGVLARALGGGGMPVFSEFINPITGHSVCIAPSEGTRCDYRSSDAHVSVYFLITAYRPGTQTGCSQPAGVWPLAQKPAYDRACVCRAAGSQLSAGRCLL